MIEPWHSHSWKKYQAKQQPFYSEQDKLQQILSRIASYPDIVTKNEIRKLCQLLSAVSRGEYFILQTGDCAERFIDSSEEIVYSKIKAIEEMRSILEAGLEKPVLAIGRIAGQYAKPRSSIFEDTPQGRVHNFRGDNINSFVVDDRRVVPEKLEQGYKLAKQSYGFIQKNNGFFSKSNLFISHEALHLPLESSLTRYDKEDGLFYNIGAHALWVGERTRFPGSAHIEYARGIENPIGIKISHDTSPNELPILLKSLNPKNTPGKITLITRLGSQNVQRTLAPFIQKVQEQNLKVLWMCDPMHGNSFITKDGFKTRNIPVILDELQKTVLVHKQEGSLLSGIHLESSGTNVTECLGGIKEPISFSDLKINYETQCDPRLNYTQGIELVEEFCHIYRKNIQILEKFKAPETQLKTSQRSSQANYL